MRAQTGDLIPRTPIFIMCGINDQKVATVIFLSLPMGLESTIQFADEAFRFSPLWARANSKPDSNSTPLWQRHDCSRDLDSLDCKRLCPKQSARLNILMECEASRRVQSSGGGVCAGPTLNLDLSLNLSGG